MRGFFVGASECDGIGNRWRKPCLILGRPKSIFMFWTRASRKASSGDRFAPQSAETLSPLLCVLGEAFTDSTFEPANTGTNKQAIEDRRAHYSNCLGWFE